MARSEAPASAKAAGNSYPLCLPPPRQSSTLHESCQYPYAPSTGSGAITNRSSGMLRTFSEFRIVPLSVLTSISQRIASEGRVSTTNVG